MELLKFSVEQEKLLLAIEFNGDVFINIMNNKEVFIKQLESKDRIIREKVMILQEQVDTLSNEKKEKLYKIKDIVDNIDEIANQILELEVKNKVIFENLNKQKKDKIKGNRISKKVALGYSDVYQAKSGAIDPYLFDRKK